MPVGAGKSSVASAIMKWSTHRQKGERTVTTTPTNILVNQYLGTFPKMPVLFGRAQYYCGLNKMTVAEKFSRELPLCQPEFMECTGCQKYLKDLSKMYSVPYGIMNNWVYLSYKMYKNFTNIISDEAHNLIPFLQELGSSRVWHHKLPEEIRYNINMRSIEDLRDWVDQIPDEFTEVDPDNPSKKVRANLVRFKRAAHSNKYLFKIGMDTYKGEDKHCIRLAPIDITEEPKIIFPPRMKKIILMSATISRKDVEQLGLYMKRVKYIDASSPIPAENRPVIIASDGLNMSYKHQDENLQALADKLVQVLEKNPYHKGIVHAPYSLVKKLWPYLGQHPRLIFHNKSNKAKMVELFKESKEPKVLMASGLYEGLDLPYDYARFQVVAKVPFPSLAEPAIKYKAERDPEWYAWECIKLFLQACGRVCRGPDDWGVTYVLDKSMNRLYFNHKDLFPKWAKEAIKWQTIAEAPTYG